jgi:hypothetical protein
MHERTVNPDTLPWYRQGWPWALIALPASAVIGGIITIILAVQSPNSLVVDDYYKEGLAINQQKHRLAAADAITLQGLLRYDGNWIRLELSSSPAIAAEELTLQVIHSTRAELDRSMTLQRSGNAYLGQLEELEAGSWYLRLQPTDLAWEIRGKFNVNGPFQTLLTAKD